MLARTMNLLLGQWLIVSAFVWRHGHPQFTNTILVGVLSMAVAFFAVTHPAARRWNLLLSAWLLVSTALMPHQTATIWNNVLVAIAMFGLALVRSPVTQRSLTLDERLRIIANAMARNEHTRSA